MPWKKRKGDEQEERKDAESKRNEGKILMRMRDERGGETGGAF